MAEQREIGEQIAAEGIFAVLGNMAWFFFALFIFLIGTAMVTLAVTIVGCSEMSGQQISWQEALSRTFGMRLLRLFGQYILQGLLFAALILVPYIILITAIALGSLLLGLAAGALLFASVLAVIYLATSWTFTVPTIGWEEADVIQSLRRSWLLVKANWWRVFGILLLMSIILSFAISLIMTPIYLIALWNFFVSYFQMLDSLGAGRPDPSVLFENLRSMGIGLGVVSGLSTILEMLVRPLYVTVLYFDLRARKGEFLQPPSAAA
jgi:hypothetical protein